MRIFFVFTLMLMVSINSTAQVNSTDLGSLADLALNCLQQEYPNKLNQVVNGPEDLQSPKQLHPAFYGCFDWHSSVHGHWMLVRLLKANPDMEQAAQIREKLNHNLTLANIKQEVNYFGTKNNRMFERTYGWAWLLKLAEELHNWEDEDAQRWAKNLTPLTDLIVGRYIEFLPKLTYPIRTGEHPNTAFGLSFAWDFAVAADNQDLKDVIAQRAKDWFAKDANGPIVWEPNGFDFLSPCLEEARIMSRVLSATEFEKWCAAFLPGLEDTKKPFLTPATVSDRTDGKLVHLDGLNLSRAWCLRELASVLPNKYGHLKQLADTHFAAGSAEILSGHYAGEHWLASFAVYAYFSEK